MHIDPLKALFWAAILNGIVAAPPYGRHHGYGVEPEGDGQARDPPLPQDHGLDCNCCHVLRVHRRHLDMEVGDWKRVG